jgi:hypothetical protein
MLHEITKIRVFQISEKVKDLYEIRYYLHAIGGHLSAQLYSLIPNTWY